MRLRRLSLLVTSLFFAAACSSPDAAPSGSRADVAVSDSTKAARAVSWFDGVAPLLLVPAHSPDRALVVPADSLAPDLEDGALQEPATLVRLDGSVSTVRVALSSSSEGCVSGVLQPAPTAGWGVGFIGRAPEVIRVDSLRAMASHDSATLTPIVFRLASGVPNAPGGRFVGLPFSLVELWRAHLRDGAMVLVATTRRQLNQEDSPLEERTLLIAEGDSAGNLALRHSSRSAGPEETVEGHELLGMAAFPGAASALMVIAHNFGDENAYSILQRDRPGAWTLRWSSRRLTC